MSHQHSIPYTTRHIVLQFLIFFPCRKTKGSEDQTMLSQKKSYNMNNLRRSKRKCCSKYSFVDADHSPSPTHQDTFSFLENLSSDCLEQIALRLDTRSALGEIILNLKRQKENNIVFFSFIPKLQKNSCEVICLCSFLEAFV